MKNLLFFILFVLFSIYRIQAQELISSSGAFFSNGQGSIAWSMGEAIIETASDGTDTLTQGFHQSCFRFVSIDENNIPNLNVQVFPNPSHAHFTLEVNASDYSETYYEIYSMEGKLLQKQSISEEHTTINMEQYAKASYILCVYKGNIKTKSIQIIKQ